MALSRWSFSDHYIYDTGEGEDGLSTVEVCGFGQFVASDILENYKRIENKAKRTGYGFFSRLELRAYLTLWAKLNAGSLHYKDATFLINTLRLYGYIKEYLKDPYAELSSLKEIDTICYSLKGMLEYFEFKLFPKSYARKQALCIVEAKRFRKEIK